MKRTQLLVLSVLALGLQGVAHATYPADAEASFNLPAVQTYADRYAAMSEAPSAWGVSRRAVTPHDPFPFGGGYIDD
jgi:hypothetical protein